MLEPRPYTPRPAGRSTIQGRYAGLLPFAVLASMAVFGGPTRAWAMPLERLVSPRPSHWVLDTTGTLSPRDISMIDSRVEEVRQRTGGEIAVVVVDSTDGQPPRDYATALANRWLIGDQAKRNGILILLAKSDRRAEIALAKGIDGERETGVARDIMERSMVPRFKAGDYPGGLYAGVEGAAERILDDPGTPAGSDPLRAGSGSAVSDQGSKGLVGSPGASDTGAAHSPFQIETARDHERFWGITLSLLILGGSVAFLLQRRPRSCPKCREPMVRLQPEQETAYLDEGQEKEREIDSIDYKIWLCLGCHTVDVRPVGRFLSPYRSCPSCHSKTMWIGSLPLVAATQMEGGVIELTERCKRCPYLRTYRQSTPRLARPSAALPSSSTSSSTRSRSGGGGSFRGGGARGSW